MYTLSIKTSKKEEIIDITQEVAAIVQKAGIDSGLCVIYSPHTTAGVTINEGADPDVKKDVLLSLNDIVKELNFQHVEGNSSAHVKTILIGKSQTIIIKNNKLVLGTWDSVYFCEFDGPRNRTVYINLIAST